MAGSYIVGILAFHLTDLGLIIRFVSLILHTFLHSKVLKITMSARMIKN